MTGWACSRSPRWPRGWPTGATRPPTWPSPPCSSCGWPRPSSSARSRASSPTGWTAASRWSSCDVARFALFLSIPLVGTLWWLFVATFLIEVASLFWIPAKEATIPNLVPRERLEAANQLSLFTTYGSAPVAAAIFAGLALLTGMLDNAVPEIAAVDLALYVNAATFLVSAFTILRLTAIPGRQRLAAGEKRPGVWRTLVEGWRYVGHNRLVRGLVLGMLGAFAAGGAVIGLAPHLRHRPRRRRPGLRPAVRHGLPRHGGRHAARPAAAARLQPAADVRPVHRRRRAGAGAARR